jgi:serine/threonine protein phosphatase 1
MIPVYQENTRGDDWVIGDLHGHVAKLREKMARKGFNPAVDRLFSTGDLVDRGPDSEGSAALLDEPWFYPVQGNHEASAIDCAAGTVTLSGICGTAADGCLERRKPRSGTLRCGSRQCRSRLRSR